MIKIGKNNIEIAAIATAIIGIVTAIGLKIGVIVDNDRAKL